MASGESVRNRKKELSWRRHLKVQPQGGLSVAAYCRRHSLRECGFYWWRRELARRDAAVPAAFVPVHVTAKQSSTEDEEEREGIEIVLPDDRGERRVRVTGTLVDRRMLADVLWVLEEDRLEREEDRRC